MGLAVIVILLIAWLVSPVVLTVLYTISRRKLKKRDMLIRHLYEQKRIDDVEFQASGVKLPQVPAVPQPVPVQQNPDELLSAAAERAKAIAESELGGEPLPQTAMPVSLEKAEPVSQHTTELHIPETETAFVSEPAANMTEPVPQPVYVQPAQPGFAPPVSMQPKQKKSAVLSPISVLLTVGVVLIIVAGLIFVRSAWGTMTDGAKLLTLAAGGTLFFGTSAVAGRGLKLERTCTAFYTLGAVFFPISIWTAGFFNLLGSGLSGASNARLYALSFAAFTLCAFIAVKIFRQKSWGIASLCGLTAAVWAGAAAIAQQIPVNISETDRTLRYAGAMAAAAAYSLFVAYACRPLKSKLPDEINAFSEIFAIAIACTTALAMPVLEVIEGRELICACVVFLMLAVFCSPVLTDALGNISALPMTLLGMYCFRFLFDPLRWNSMTEKGLHSEERFALNCIVCAVIWLLMLLAKSLPDAVKKGAVTASYVLGCLAVVSQIAAQAADHMALIIPAAALILIVLMGICAGKEVSQPNRWLLAAEVLAVCTDVEALLIRYKISSEPWAELILCGMLLACFAGFTVLKRWRSLVSDLLFPIAAVITAIIAADNTDDQLPAKILCVAVILAAAAAFWLLAMEKGSQKKVQWLHAVLMPAACGIAAMLTDELFIVCRGGESIVLLVWSIVMYAAGLATVITAKEHFNGVRRLMTLLAAVPPVYAAVTGNLRIFGADLIRMQIVGVIAAVIFWQLLERRKMVGASCAAFGTGLFLAAEVTCYALRRGMYDGFANFTQFMVASLWILAAALAAIAEKKYQFEFTGSRSICTVGRIFAPAAAFILSVLLLVFSADTEQFCFVYTLAFVAVSWLTAKPEHVVMPCVSVFALIFTAEAIREQTHISGYSSPVLLLLIMCGMEILFPYLGKVLREGGEEGIAKTGQRRSWSLTAVGVLVPLWLMAVSSQREYSYDVRRWFIFFIPVLAAGFVLHFVPEVKTENQRKMLVAVSSALCMIAFWMQPLIDVKDTYFEGKLHLLPLIAFGIVLRKLYGAETGGGFLFGVGVYAMFRLAASAISSEDAADLLTVLGAGFAIFTGSFYVKQKKWFLLGGISLLLTAVYMHMKLMNGAVWWVYLLVIGLLLLGIGAVNEMLRQRGDSLKSKAGRLWEEWRW